VELPLRILPWKITVGGDTFPLAEMMGIMVAVALVSFLSAICCFWPLDPIWHVLCTLLSRKQHVSSMAKMQSCSMLQVVMVVWSSSNQSSTMAEFRAPPHTVVNVVDQ